MIFENIKPYLRFVRYLEINSDTSYSPHVPYDARMFYTIDGCSTISLQGKSYDMQKGCMLIIPAGVEYLLENPENKVVYIAINFDYTQISADKKTPIPPVPREHFDINAMTENMKRFLETVSKDEALTARVGAMGKEELLALAKELGLELVIDDMGFTAALEAAH